jgi:hypothetical protein
MNSPAILLILFLFGALVAIGSGIAINSLLLIGAGVGLAVIGIVLTARAKRGRS